MIIFDLDQFHINGKPSLQTLESD